MVALIEMMKLVPPRHWAWAIAKLCAAAWMVAYTTTASPETFSVMGLFIVFFMYISAMGGIVSIAGMIYSQSRSYEAPRRGLTIELVGLYIFMVAPVAHVAAMVAITVEKGNTYRVGPMMESLAIAAFIMVRVVEVMRPWSKMTDRSK